VYTTGQIEDYLRGVIVNEFNDMLGAVHTTLLDLPGQTSELAAAMRNALVDDFRRIGLDITSFQIIAITPPDDIQRRIDERTSTSILGDSANALSTGAATAIGADSDAPALGAPQTEFELGAGPGIGPAVSPAIRESVAEPVRLGRTGTVECPHCHAQAPADARFCSNCGRPLQSQPGSER
jgi:membrane protease subunit (stomatin/prohibitin family)